MHKWTVKYCSLFLAYQAGTYTEQITNAKKRGQLLQLPTLFCSVTVRSSETQRKKLTWKHINPVFFTSLVSVI